MPGATAYEVWRGTTPYFTPGEAGTTKAATTAGTTYSDPGRSGDPAANYYYLILATANACPLAASQRIGEFDFALTPGAALNVAAVRAVVQARGNGTLSYLIPNSRARSAACVRSRAPILPRMLVT